MPAAQSREKQHLPRAISRVIASQVPPATLVEAVHPCQDQLERITALEATADRLADKTAVLLSHVPILGHG